MGATRTNDLKQGSRDKAAIDQYEHAGFDRRQQAARQALFGGLARGGDDLDDGRGTGFDQVDAAQLRVGTTRLALGDATRVLGIGGSIVDFFQGAIDGHQPQAKGEGAWRVFVNQWHTRLLHGGVQEPHLICLRR